MELSFSIILRTIAIIVLAAAAIGFTGVSFLTRVRAGLVMGIGVILLGVIAWPMLKPALPLAGVTLYEGDISILDAVVCIGLAFLSGLVSYFVATPYGRQLAPLAAPSGMAYIAFRSGDMLSLINVNNTLQERIDLYAALKWEGFFFIAIIAAGYLGVLTALKLTGKKPVLTDMTKTHKYTFNKALSGTVAVIATVIIAQFVIGILAQDVRQQDQTLGSVVGNVHVGQIAFAVMVAFGVAAFATQYFLGTSYVLVTLTSVLVTFYSLKVYAKPDLLEYMTLNWPTAFFPRAICAVLPIQMITFAAIGAMAGYFSAIKVAEPEKVLQQGEK